MTLLSNEQTLATCQGTPVTLTNRRIVSESTDAKSYAVIFLAHLSAIRAIYKSNPVLVVIGVILAFFAFYMLVQPRYAGTQGAGILVGIIAVAFILAYFSGRKLVVALVSDSGTAINLEGNSTDVNKFVQQVQEAKVNGTGLLSTTASATR